MAERRFRPLYNKLAAMVGGTTAAVPARTGPRRRKPAKYRSFRLQKRIKHAVKIPNAFKLSKMAGATLWRSKRLFIGIAFIYAAFYLILVTGLSNNIDVTGLKTNLQTIFGGNANLSSSLAVFAVLLGSSGTSASGAAGAYQLFLILIVSLAVIWSLREVVAGVNVRVRDAYYRGMYPLVPFMIVLLVIGFQFLPLIIGASLYSIVTSNGIAVYAAEKLLWGLLFAMLSLLSVYMVSSSSFALYIVTLPEMTPLKALRSARQLVRYRRWTVLRKVLALPLVLFLLLTLIMLPVLLFVTVIAQWVFYILTMVSIVAVHAYLYTLYRELIRE